MRRAVLISGQPDTVRTFWLAIRQLVNRNYRVNVRRRVTVNPAAETDEGGVRPLSGSVPGESDTDLKSPEVTAGSFHSEQPDLEVRVGALMFEIGTRQVVFES